MHDGHQRDRWDHTANMLAAWSSKSVDPATLNPYRRRQSRGRPMPPAELYAIQAAIAKRNADRAKQ